jgi:hypothetical protein
MIKFLLLTVLICFVLNFDINNNTCIFYIRPNCNISRHIYNLTEHTIRFNSSSTYADLSGFDPTNIRTCNRRKYFFYWH